MIHIIGAGLAGSEAAYQLAQRGHKVHLYEMRLTQSSPAHHTKDFAELVCSNSLKSNRLDNAAGLLKEEMRQLGSLIIKTADHVAVPAGQALAVDRDLFSQTITQTIRQHPLITIHSEEVITIPDEGYVLIATGPLTSLGLTQTLQTLLGEKHLYFYDAAAPLVQLEGIDMAIAYRKSRYDKGGDDYINCPMTKEQFLAFYEALTKAERVPLKEFEKELHFEACMPIEIIGQKNPRSLVFGPLKPVGLEMPNGKRPYAVVQLRQDNQAGDLFNMVGFQTNLKYGEQDRIFRMIPGLEKATFVRHGFMHRNTYIASPVHLWPTLQLKQNERVLMAGQIIGVEGYVESAASGILAAINIDRLVHQKPPLTMPLETVLGSLINYVTSANVKDFQPMNANYGVVFQAAKDRQEVANRSMNYLREWKTTYGI